MAAAQVGGGAGYASRMTRRCRPSVVEPPPVELSPERSRRAAAKLASVCAVWQLQDIGATWICDAGTDLPAELTPRHRREETPLVRYIVSRAACLPPYSHDARHAGGAGLDQAQRCGIEARRCAIKPLEARGDGVRARGDSA